MSVVSPCFTPGSLIATERGMRPVETLKRGDRLVTRDNGLKRIMWIGGRTLSYQDLLETPELTPILIRAGAFGDGYPSRDIIVSPEHRFLVTRNVSPLTAGEPEALIAACHLVDYRVVRPASMLGVTYLHVMMNAHEVILANGSWTESFHPDDKTLAGIGPGQRHEIMSLFPEIETMGAAVRFPPVRPIFKSRFDS